MLGVSTSCTKYVCVDLGTSHDSFAPVLQALKIICASLLLKSQRTDPWMLVQYFSVAISFSIGWLKWKDSLTWAHLSMYAALFCLQSCIYLGPFDNFKSILHDLPRSRVLLPSPHLHLFFGLVLNLITVMSAQFQTKLLVHSLRNLFSGLVIISVYIGSNTGPFLSNQWYKQITQNFHPLLLCSASFVSNYIIIIIINIINITSLISLSLSYHHHHNHCHHHCHHH